MKFGVYIEVDEGCMYDPIQGHGHRACEVPKIALFKAYLLLHLQWELASDHSFLNYCTISQFDGARFFIFVLLFVSRDLGLAEVPAISPSRRKFFQFQ